MADLKPIQSLPINLKVPLRRSPRGAFATNDSTLEAVADDLKCLILTNHGERVIHYDFGANLRALIFEQGIDVKQQIADAITSAVEKWMPFVAIRDMQIILSDEDLSVPNNQVKVKISFFVGKTGLQGDVVIDVKR